MHSHLFAIADIWPRRREFAIFYLCTVPILLVFVSIAIYRSIAIYGYFKSNQRQGKQWVWYKQSSVITTIGVVSIFTANVFGFGIEDFKIIPDNPFTTTLIWVPVLAGTALLIYSKNLSD